MSPSLHTPATELDALARDAADPLRGFRDEFLIPPHGDDALHYFCGNSLGLQPRAARDAVETEMDRWARLAVEGHFRGETAWMTFHEGLRDLRRVRGVPDRVLPTQQHLDRHIRQRFTEAGKPLPPDLAARAKTVLDRADAFEAASARPIFSFFGQRPPADLIIMVTPGVRRLVEAAQP